MHLFAALVRTASHHKKPPDIPPDGPKGRARPLSSGNAQV